MIARLLSILPALLALMPHGLAALDVRTFTASELGFLVSSHLILGKDEAILVDAQFTRSEAFDVVRMVRSSERVLTTIFITRGQPEHYLGLEVLTRDFPEARVLARPAVAEAIRDHAQDVIERWQLIYIDDLPATVVVPEVFEEDVLVLDGVEILLLDGTDEAHPTVLYIPSEQTLLASDLVMSQVHLWLDGVDPAEWLERLEDLQEMGPIDWVYPGHGAPAGRRLLVESAAYLSTLRGALAGRPEGAELVRMMKETYPDYKLPVLLERSVTTFLERSRR